MTRVLSTTALCLGLNCVFAGASVAQVPVEGEVRQLVTFSLLPGKSAEAVAAYRDQAVPLYRQDEAMLTFRAYREAESPISMDLLVVSSFDGMSGMDASNRRLRELASAAGTSIGAIYGELSTFSSGHTDEFVEMLPSIGSGDPSASRLTALVWYRVGAGSRAAFEEALGAAVGEREDIASSVGRFLVSDGWDYLTFLGFDSLGKYQEYWSELRSRPSYARMEALVTTHREVIVSGLPELAVR